MPTACHCCHLVLVHTHPSLHLVKRSIAIGWSYAALYRQTQQMALQQLMETMTMYDDLPTFSPTSDRRTDMQCTSILNQLWDIFPQLTQTILPQLDHTHTHTYYYIQRLHCYAYNTRALKARGRALLFQLSTRQQRSALADSIQCGTCKRDAIDQPLAWSITNARDRSIWTEKVRTESK